MSLYKVISFKAMCQYEKLTGKKAMDVFKKGADSSATDIRDFYFLFKYTKDNTTTLEKIENLTAEEIAALDKEIAEAQAAFVTPESKG